METKLLTVTEGDFIAAIWQQLIKFMKSNEESNISTVSQQTPRRQKGYDLINVRFGIALPDLNNCTSSSVRLNNYNFYKHGSSPLHPILVVFAAPSLAATGKR